MRAHLHATGAHPHAIFALWQPNRKARSHAVFRHCVHICTQCHLGCVYAGQMAFRLAENANVASEAGSQALSCISFFYDPDERATNRGHDPGSETPKARGARHDRDGGDRPPRGRPGDAAGRASQILQAPAASPDCIGDGERLTLAAGAIDAAVARIDAAKPALGAEIG